MARMRLGRTGHGFRRAALIGVMAAAALVMPGAGRASAQEPPVERTVGGGGPLGAVTVIGDSVLYGSKDSLPEALVEAGFGPVRYRSALGYSTGYQLPAGHAFSTASWIQQWRAQGWDPPTLLINLGANDAGFCYNDTACAEASIRYLLDAIGKAHDVLWPMISHKYQDWADAWNSALTRLTSEFPNLTVWDWPAARVAAGIPIAGDNIHLPHTAAYASRSQLLADALVGAVAQADPSGIAAPLPQASGGPSAYVPLTPQRVVDTRQPPGQALAAGEVRTVDLSPWLPAGATAAAINVTAADAAAPGYFTVWPCGTGQPEVSSVNFVAGGARGAHAVVPLSSGSLCVYSPVAANLIVDLQGAFLPAPDGAPLPGLRYTPLAEPARLADTRGGARPQMVEVAVPAGAAAVTINLTAAEPQATGYLTASPCGGGAPTVSNVNFGPGETAAGSAYVPVGPAGTICVFTVGSPHVLVDLTGTFAADGALRFIPAAPTRVLDTRSGSGGWIGRLGAGQSVDAVTTPPGATAVTGTLTAIEPVAATFVSALASKPTGTPSTSNLNAAKATVIANSVTTSVAADGHLWLYSAEPTHLLVDVTGWWTP